MPRWRWLGSHKNIFVPSPYQSKFQGPQKINKKGGHLGFGVVLQIKKAPTTAAATKSVVLQIYTSSEITSHCEASQASKHNQVPSFTHGYWEGAEHRVSSPNHHQHYHRPPSLLFGECDVLVVDSASSPFTPSSFLCRTRQLGICGGL